MKRALMILSLGLALGMVAHGATLVIPLVADDGGASDQDGSTPATGTASFISLTNTTSSPVTITIEYASGGGVNTTPAANTYVIGVGPAPDLNGLTVGFRPIASDLNETAVLRDINATSGVVAATTITYADPATNIVARVASLNATACYGYRVEAF